MDADAELRTVLGTTGIMSLASICMCCDASCCPVNTARRSTRSRANCDIQIFGPVTLGCVSNFGKSVLISRLAASTSICCKLCVLLPNSEPPEAMETRDPFFSSLSPICIDASDDDDDDDDEEEEEEEEEEEPKPKRGAAKAAASKKSAPAAKKTKAAASSDGVLDGIVFALSGKLSEPRAALEKKITDAGGKVAKSLTKAVQYLITTDADAGTAKVQKAKDSGTNIVSEDFLNDCLEDGEVPSNLTAYLIE